MDYGSNGPAKVEFIGLDNEFFKYKYPGQPDWMHIKLTLISAESLIGSAIDRIKSKNFIMKEQQMNKRLENKLRRIIRKEIKSIIQESMYGDNNRLDPYRMDVGAHYMHRTFGIIIFDNSYGDRYSFTDANGDGYYELTYDEVLDNVTEI